MVAMGSLDSNPEHKEDDGMASFNPSLRDSPNHGYISGLESIIYSAKRAHNWRSVDEPMKVLESDPVTIRVIYHYNTAMLWLTVNEDGSPADVIDYDIGNGSVSDQHGMNRLFRALDSSLYYIRKGGARIE